MSFLNLCPLLSFPISFFVISYCRRRECGDAGLLFGYCLPLGCCLPFAGCIPLTFLDWFNNFQNGYPSLRLLPRIIYKSNFVRTVQGKESTEAACQVACSSWNDLPFEYCVVFQNNPNNSINLNCLAFRLLLELTNNLSVALVTNWFDGAVREVYCHWWRRFEDLFDW